MGSDMQIQKQTLNVSVLMREMSTEELWEGEVFFHNYDPLHSGHTFIEEMLNAEAPFFPIHFKKGGFALVNKANIIYLKHGKVDISNYKACGITPRKIQVYFKEHNFLEGDIYPELPPDSSRPLDFFNQGIRFLPIFLEQEKAIVNTEHILYVLDGTDK